MDNKFTVYMQLQLFSNNTNIAPCIDMLAYARVCEHAYVFYQVTLGIVNTQRNM